MAAEQSALRIQSTPVGSWVPASEARWQAYLSARYNPVASRLVVGPRAMFSLASTELPSSFAFRFTNEAPATRRLGARNAGLEMDYPGLGAVDPKSRLFTEYAEAMAQKHGVRLEFTTEVSFGYADEVAGVIRLNPETATWSVLNHEVSHMRFYQAMGKWKTGEKLTNFELNLMEAIGYHETYLEGQMFGVARKQLLEDTAIGAGFTQPAVQAILRSDSPAVRASLDKAIKVWGRDFVEEALRNQGRGLHPRKPLNLPK